MPKNTSLFAISQRYYIESNSQPASFASFSGTNCLLSRKDTTLKAIHNGIESANRHRPTVCYLAKILHWKQFTTTILWYLANVQLFAISQRYYIESNSQRQYASWFSVKTVCYLAKILHWKQFTTSASTCLLILYCLLSRKDTTLKAIHNLLDIRPSSTLTVCYLAKILHWKQFTTKFTKED